MLGAGAVGCLWSTRLALAGAAPTLLLRPRSPKAAMRTSDGFVQLRLENAAGAAMGSEKNTSTVQVKAEVIGEEETVAAGSGGHGGVRNIRALLVATKVYEAVGALEAVAPRLAPDVVLVLLSNGALALSERLSAHPTLSRADVVLGSTTHGAWVRGPLDVVHAGLGDTWLGRAPGATLSNARYAETLAGLGSADLGATDAGAKILNELWLKLAANAVINPLTCLWEVPNGEVLKRQEGIDTLNQVCQEVSNVAAALAQGTGLEVLSAEELKAFVHAVAGKTARNHSSMLQDVWAHRTTEIDFLNGWVASKGEELGVRVPANADLAKQVREKQSVWQS